MLPNAKTARSARGEGKTNVGRVIALANHKGGVGKTTAAANLGAALAMLGHSVLLIDADPQANLGEAFGLDDDSAPGLRLEDILAQPHWSAAPAVWEGRFDHETNAVVPLAGGVHMVPCTDALAAAAAALAGEAGAEHRLRDVVALWTAAYDWIVIDTPPGLGVLSSMAMLAAQGVIVPARPADLDISGAVKIADVLEGEITSFNPHVRLIGVLIGQVDRRWHLRHDTRSALHDADLTQLDVEIPFAVRVGAAPRYNAPTVVLEPDSRVARAYQRLARQLAADGINIAIQA